MLRNVVKVLPLLLYTLHCTIAAAAAPRDSMNVQGVLREDMGGLQDGLFDFRVRLLDGGAAFFDRTYEDVPVESGVFSIDLALASGSLAELLRQHPEALVEISVDGVAFPAQPLHASPYALVSAHADVAASAERLGGVPAASYTLHSELADDSSSSAPVHWSGLVGFPADCAPGSYATGINGDGTLRCNAVTAGTGGGGSITEILAGTGLAGGGATGSISLAVDPSVVQTRVQPCSAGQAIRAVNEDGTVECEATSSSGVTGVIAGVGLSGGGSAGMIDVAADVAYLQRRIGSGCAVGSFITAVAQDGTVTCRSPFVRTIVVGPAATAPASGAALLAAMATITDASDTNRYVIRLEPGVYDLGNAALLLRPFIRIQGAGRGDTTLIGSGSPSGTNGEPNTGTINAGLGGAISDLTVRNSGSGYATALYVGGGDVQVDDVELIAEGGVTRTCGIFCAAGGVVAGSRVQISATAAGADSYGIRTKGASGNRCSVQLSDVEVTGRGPKIAWGIVGSDATIKLDGARMDLQGADTSNAFFYVDATLTMHNVTISASGGSVDNNAFYLTSTSLEATGIRATITGANSTGLLLVNAGPIQPAISIAGSKFVVGGIPGSSAAGVRVRNSPNGGYTTVLEDVTLMVTGTGAGMAPGIAVEDPGSSVTVHHGRVVGDPGITSVGGAEINIGASELTGGALGSGLTCVHAYTSQFGALNSTCL